MIRGHVLVFFLIGGVGADGHVQLLSRDSLIQAQHIIRSCFEVTRGVIRLGHEDMIPATVRHWLIQIRHTIKSIPKISKFYMRMNKPWLTFPRFVQGG